MIISIHQPNYIPWIGYFYKIAKSDIFVFLDDVQYEKNGFTDRNRIKTPQGELYLKIPINLESHLQKINQIEIREHLGWREKHLKSIDMNYRKSKYYREIFPLMEECLSIASSNLAAYNSQVVKKILDVLDIDTNCIYSHELGITAVGTERLVEIVKCLDGSTYLSGSGGSKYQDEEIFKAHGIQLSYSRFIPPKYTQCWGDFISNLSIVDYLFNNGISDCRKYLEL